MRYIYRLVYVLLCGFIVAPAVYAERVAVPVGLNMYVSAQEQGMMMLTVYMTVQEDAQKAMLLVSAPRGARLYEGQTHWEGNLKPGNTIKLVSWYDVSKLEEGNAPSWKVIAGGTIDGLHRFRMQPLVLSGEQLAKVLQPNQQVSALSLSVR